MPMKNEKLYIALSQILLIDPASETPKVHSGRKSISKKQMMRRLQLLINEYQELELDIDLTPYEETIEHLKILKENREYDELIQEIVDAYNPDYGVVYEQIAEAERLAASNEYSKNRKSVTVPAEESKSAATKKSGRF